MIDPLLLELLACPTDKGPLHYFADRELLFNPRLGRTYPIVDDIPVMLVEQATTLDAEAAAELQRRIDVETIPTTLSGR